MSIKESKRDELEGLSNKAKLNGTDKSSKPPYSNSKRPPWSVAFANLRCSQRRVMSPGNDAALWSQVCNRRFAKNNFRQNAGQMTDTNQIKQTKQTKNATFLTSRTTLIESKVRPSYMLTKSKVNVNKTFADMFFKTSKTCKTDKRAEISSKTKNKIV